ncbi:hypothetical protein W02_20280 [Nitrospira sp. KM1]|uniref:YkgJ family cysteine cluster protein n=1 Tax=Nitrospira sp. KM1 TaxID=1936990 RepID=UPI0013A77BE9|nr:YkgJ family cysteine cluster protein [Nitrospira sp. KM1]BCA54888.1 hypothetical protein W02_20280 [Nitrospira sp. KM1]
MARSLLLFHSALPQKTDDWFHRVSALHLGQVPCQAGCSACCIGTFPITLLDVRSLREGLTRLPATRRERIEETAQIQRSLLAATYPTLSDNPFVDSWSDENIDQLVEQYGHLRCPALGDDDLCSLYEFRPLACRSMGIPIEQDGAVAGACHVQTFVPITRMTTVLRTEEATLARQEGKALELERKATGAGGDEVLLPYGFLPLS